MMCVEDVHSMLLPYILEDAFFRTYLAAELFLLDTVVEVAEGDSWPLFLDVLFNAASDLLSVSHLHTGHSDQQKRTKGESRSRSDCLIQRFVQADRERPNGECNQLNCCYSYDLWTCGS